MICKRCKAVLEEELAFCRKCGADKPTGENKIEHYVPIGISVFAYVVFYWILGGREQANFFDYLTVITAFCSLLLTLVLVPRKRTAVFIASLVVSGLVMVWGISYIVLSGMLNWLVDWLETIAYYSY